MFSFKEAVKRHEARHVQPKDHECSKCNKKFAESESLKRHMKTHLPRSERKHFSCPSCQKTFVSAPGLKRHKCKMNPDKRCSWEVQRCLICDKTFENIIYLKAHMKRHLEESEQQHFPCEKCPRYFLSKEGLIHHKCSTDQAKFKCKKCDQSFLERRHLTKHSITHTPEFVREQLTCKKCNKFYLSKQGFVNHDCKKCVINIITF